MRKKILIIESDLFLSGLMCEFIEIGGFEAEGADCFEEGWERAISGRYDLILLDLNWALLNGMHPDGKFGKLLRAPLILLAYPDEIDRHCLSGRPETRDLLTKPFTFMELMLKVKEVLTPLKNRNNSSTPMRSLTRIGVYPPPTCQRETEFLAVVDGA